MNKRFPLFMLITAMILSLAVWPNGVASAAIADGTYKVNYEMKEANSNNTSIADGYFAKPATLTVKNGVQHIQLTVTSAEMIKSLSAPSGPVSVVSDNGDTRTVKFQVDGDLSQPVNMKMHIVVPDLYDTNHTARAVFDVSGLKGAATDSSNSGESAGKAIDNPPTGDNSSIALYVLLLVGAVAGILVVRKLRPAHNE